MIIKPQQHWLYNEHSETRLLCWNSESYLFKSTSTFLISMLFLFLQHSNSHFSSFCNTPIVLPSILLFKILLLDQVDRQEPTSYNHLPRQSIVRGLVTSLQQLCKVTSPENIKTINLCLTALYQPTPKPLPSMSWAFLQNLLNCEDVKLTESVVRLAAKQSQISPTARKITEAHITGCGNEVSFNGFFCSLPFYGNAFDF